MPPREVGAVTDPLVAAYQKSYERISKQLAGAAAESARANRLREVRASVERELAYLNREVAPRAVQATRWAGDVGFGAGQVGAGARTASLDQIDRGAVERAAQGLYKDLLRATSRVDQTSKTVLRKLGRGTSLEKLIEGRTAVQAGRAFARQAHELGVHAVVYSNGARHGLDEYAAMAMRTVTGTVYNEALVEGALAEGCEWFECFDGPDCGLEAHDDTNVADGLVVDAKTASSYPLSHPNCRRSWGPRPDVKSQKEADAARRSTSQAQREDQIAADRARGLPVRPAAEREALRASRGQRASKPELGQRPSKATQGQRPPKAASAAPREPRPLTRDHEDAVSRYTSMEGLAMNRSLRRGRTLSDDNAKAVGFMDEAIASRPAASDMTLYRSVRMEDVLEDVPRDRWVGTTFRDNGFVSTSADRELASRFPGELVEMRVSQGQPALDVGSMGVSQKAFEKEWLLPRGQTYRITAERGGFFEMEVVPDG